jgi:hypothetical protein
MAEVVGVLASGFTLAGLFKMCLDAIDLIQTAQHQELDLKKLLLKLNIEKCRLYTWGEGMGLTAALVAGRPRPLDSCPDHVQDLVKDTLDMIIQLFTDTKKLKYRYGCKEILPQTASYQLPILTSDFGPMENLAASFSHYRVRTGAPGNVAQLTLKTRSVIHDRKKFISLIAEVKDFVDGLQNLTRSLYPVVHQENNIKLGVQQINDVNTLDLLAEVREVEHPAISDAASEKSEILSIPTTRRREIE